MRSLFFLILFSFGSQSIAKIIETPYLRFQVPESYNCQAEDAYYQCQDSTGQKMKDSILIVAFKKAGPQDTIEQYMSLLTKPFTRLVPGEPPALSQVLFTKKETVLNHEWAMAKHFESDLPNYFTYHYSTVSGAVAMVVKYSVLKKSDEKRKPDLMTIVSSLETKKVSFTPESELTAPPSFSPGGPAAPTAAGVGAESTQLSDQKSNFTLTQKALLFAICGAILFLVGFTLFKK